MSIGPRNPLSGVLWGWVVIVIVFVLLIVAAVFAFDYVIRWCTQYPRIADGVNFLIAGLVMYFNWS